MAGSPEVISPHGGVFRHIFLFLIGDAFFLSFFAVVKLIFGQKTCVPKISMILSMAGPDAFTWHRTIWRACRFLPEKTASDMA
jgi:hypothetical protein